uniref:NADH dehydrogenase subunit 4 n=1 Tax=Pseudodiaptomus hessei TaxID=2919416 RepID=UPI002A7F5998|nr:NADH dehydrogenase subunit 4 [Pseudodiaptomus hessei]WOH21591.1 NADH dehydrogenase subunit 4 [Pseudodiaptomus hessei]
MMKFLFLIMFNMNNIMFLSMLMFLINLMCLKMPVYSINMIGVDSLSIYLIVLSVWLLPLMSLANWGSKYFNLLNNLFKLLLLVLILVFVSQSTIMFYVMFEASLIPIFMIILGWGYQPERLLASLFMLFYTLTASLPLLFVIMLVYSMSGSMMFFSEMMITGVSPMISVMCMMGFMVKLPIFFFHLWLPKAHVEAPVSGSMILAGVLLKLGGYGLIRFSLVSGVGLFPFISLASLGGMMLAIFCCRAADMKVMIAYSSVVHMTMILVVYLTFSKSAFEGALWIMLAHGITSSGMFAGANLMYERSHSRSLMMNKGILNIMPMMSLFWFLLIVLNFAGPWTINLYGEILLITGMLASGIWMIIPVAGLSFFSAAYNLVLYASLHQGVGFSTQSFNLKMLMREALFLFNHLWPGLLMLLMLVCY